MGYFTSYTFSAAIFLLAGYLVYKWLLSNENQPAFNRMVILTIYAMSFVLPLFRIHIHSSAPSDVKDAVMSGLTSAASIPEAPAITATRILLWIYLIGMIAVSLFTLFSFIRLRRLVASGEQTKIDGYTLVTISRTDLAPFSWGHYIVVSHNEDAEALRLIIRHERAHIRLGHFYDLLLAQLVCILQWYNPASWLMLSELQAVHEYQADHAVLREGTNIRQYQTLLIKKTVGSRFQSFANSLNHSNLKKRITMMYEAKTKPMRRFRALVAVPAAALALALLNVAPISGAVTQMSTTRLTDKVSGFSQNSQADKKTAKTPAEPVHADTAHKTPTVSAPEKKSARISKPQKSENQTSRGTENKDDFIDVLPEYPGGMSVMFEALTSAIQYPAEAFKAQIQGKVVVGLTIDADGRMTDATIIKGVDPLLDAEAIRAVTTALGAVTWTPGMRDGKPVKCSIACPVAFKLK